MARLQSCRSDARIGGFNSEVKCSRCSGAKADSWRLLAARLKSCPDTTLLRAFAELLENGLSLLYSYGKIRERGMVAPTTPAAGKRMARTLHRCRQLPRHAIRRRAAPILQPGICGTVLATSCRAPVRRGAIFRGPRPRPAHRDLLRIGGRTPSRRARRPGLRCGSRIGRASCRERVYGTV